MDTMLMKERNYRMVEMLRHQNEREQRRLEASLYSSGGLQANHRYNMENMNREQRLLKEELTKLKQAPSTTWGVLPPREGEESEEKAKEPDMNPTKKKSRRRSRSNIEEKKEAELKKAAKALQKFHDDYPDGSDSSRVPQLPQLATDRSQLETVSTPSMDIPLADIKLDLMKESVSKRLVNSDKAEPASAPSPRGPSGGGALSPVREETVLPVREETVLSVKEETVLPETQTKSPADSKETKSNKWKKAKKVTAAVAPQFDAHRYNPDGSLRTVHTLPDFQTSLREAMKARYLRMKGAQWIERELTGSEIFGRKRTLTGASTISHKSN